MKKDFTPKYKYIFTPSNQVICISRYAKKQVKGVAKCSPEDSYDAEVGIKLAKLRCDLKVAEMRYKNASDTLAAITDYLNNVVLPAYENAKAHLEDADVELSDLVNEYDNFRNSL